jgi:hypothetical protein
VAAPQWPGQINNEKCGVRWRKRTNKKGNAWRILVFLDSAKLKAELILNHFQEEILEQLVKHDKVYVSGLLWESILEYVSEYVNADGFDLVDSAKIIMELSDYEETDAGLWNGLSVKDCLRASAGYAYKNCVLALIRRVLTESNELYYDEDTEESPKAEFYNKEMGKLVDRLLG